MTWYALCQGQGLRICASCRRHAENNPKAAQDKHQQWMAPASNGERCGDWLALPESKKVRA